MRDFCGRIEENVINAKNGERVMATTIEVNNQSVKKLFSLKMMSHISN